MSSFFRKTGFLGAMCAGCLTLFSAMPVTAAENESEDMAENSENTENAEEIPEVNISTSLISMDEESGEYSFEINIDSQEAYAGAEFGIICSQGTEVTSVMSTAGSVTGPKESSGLVWFGFFDGEDSFCEEVTVTVEGNYEPGKESAIVVQDIKIYTIGDQEYASTYLDGGFVVNISSDSVQEILPEEPEEKDDNGISVIVLIACCVVIAAGAAGALVYKKKKPRGEKK